MLSLAVLSFIPAFAVASFQVGGAVETADGVVIRGHASTWQPTVSEYLGIPFAAPPVGGLRWKAPQPFKGENSTVIIADKYSPDCPANAATFSSKTKINSPPGVILASLGQYGDYYDEDCLTVNVWTKPQSGEKAKAVLVWIYGGGFALGNTASPAYNGARLAAEQDVVVVSMNYRLNILGFPGAPGIPDQNLGLLDQRLAVEWVRDNIAAFGGDPKRITLFGESAGGASVDMYAYAWTKDPIVNSFIAESGTSSLGDSLGGTGDKSTNWYKASQKAGCGGREAGEKTVECMRSKPWKDVLAAIKPEGAAANLGGMGDFGPIADGKVVFSDYKAREAAGNFVQRPMLVGNNANEVALFLVILEQTSLLSNPMLKMANGAFSCPSGTAAKARSDKKVKSYRYLYAGEWPNQQLAPNAGAWHGSEIGAVFGSVEYQQTFYGGMIKENINFPDTDPQKALTKTMMGAWAGFAKDPDNALDRLGWPVYDPSKPTVIQLGGPNSSAVTFISPQTLDSSCSLLSSLMSSMGGSGGLTGLLGSFVGGAKGAGGSTSAKGPAVMPRRVRKY